MNSILKMAIIEGSSSNIEVIQEVSGDFWDVRGTFLPQSLLIPFKELDKVNEFQIEMVHTEFEFPVGETVKCGTILF